MDLIKGEVAVQIDPDRIKPQKIIEIIDGTCDSAHCFKAKLKAEPKDEKAR